MDFFLTLPSNSNLDLYKDNSLNQFTVNFNRPLPIDETFELGLSEIHFPYHTDERISTTSEDYITLAIKKSLAILKIPMPKETWANKTVLLEQINHIIVAVVKEKGYRTITPFVKYGDKILKTYNDHDVKITLSYTLTKKLLGKQLDYIYIYCDVIDHSFVGDGLVKLLRIVDVGCAKGEVCSVIYQTPQYHNVVVKEPRTIEISLRNSLGDLVSLKSEGSTVVVLHARKKLM